VGYQLKMETSVELRILSAKIRSVAYLIENHRDEVGEPLDRDDIYWGLGRILTDISEAVKQISIEAGRSELVRQRKRS